MEIKPGRYAKGTRVLVNQSISEIEKLMERFGVDITQHFAEAKSAGQYQCWWQIDGVTFTVQIDTRDEPNAQEVRRRWRVIVQHIKSQLIAVEEGLLDSKTALAPFLMLEDGSMGRDRLKKFIEQNSYGTPMLEAPNASTKKVTDE